jgi:hypothetical protein
VQSAVLQKSLILLPALPFKLIETADQFLHHTGVSPPGLGDSKKPGSIVPYGMNVKDEQ